MKRTVAFCAFVCVGALEVFFAVMDYGIYGQTFQGEGLLGILELRSLLTFQICYLLVLGYVLIAAVRSRPDRKSRIIASLGGIAFVVYVLSLFGFHWASHYGEFGIGGFGFIFVFGFLPSSIILYLAVPILMLCIFKWRSPAASKVS